ncbi:Pre-rRNA-processing protein rix1 [Erysiphe necator]|nr:Pre-rRNA-processing protein rix1 [Erysiphe necator]
MSLPPDLRVLCDQISSVPVVELPSLLPSLSQKILYCKGLVTKSTSQSDTSGVSILVHKLKTRLTTLLNGKQPEGRFVAIVLIKAFIDIGGWDALKTSGPWVRGLLSILGKPDPFISKELCTITLTKLYILIYNYPNLVREIATPTLPTYVTTCLNLISTVSSKRVSSVPSTLLKAILHSFCTLIPRYASIYRPFSSQIRLHIGQLLAPSSSEIPYIPQSLREAARKLIVTLHETVPKTSCSVEWRKAITDLVHNIHVTSDQVFRSVTENWESSVGYGSEPVNIKKGAQDGGISKCITPWTSIEAGTDILIGLLELLAMYFLVGTSGPVTVPIAVIKDMMDRILSVLPNSESNDGEIMIQLNPSVGRDEKDILCCRLPYIHSAVLRLWLVIADRIEENFMPFAQECFDQMVWVFPHGMHIPEFRLAIFELMTQVLLTSGKSFDKAQIDRASIIIKSCCDELNSDRKFTDYLVESGNRIMSNLDENKNLIADLLRKQNLNFSNPTKKKESDVFSSASRLLPLFLSHISQEHFNLSTRSMIDRTAILSKNREAMLASVLNPVKGNYDREIPSILPYLTQAYASDDIVEILLRPRMPQVSLEQVKLYNHVSDKDISMAEEMDFQHEVVQSYRSTSVAETFTPDPTTNSMFDIIPPTLDQENEPTDSDLKNEYQCAPIALASESSSHKVEIKKTSENTIKDDRNLETFPEESNSDDESVHLTMQLDTDSESDEDIG